MDATKKLKIQKNHNHLFQVDFCAKCQIPLKVLLSYPVYMTGTHERSH